MIDGFRMVEIATLFLHFYLLPFILFYRIKLNSVGLEVDTYTRENYQYTVLCHVYIDVEYTGLFSSSSSRMYTAEIYSKNRMLKAQ